MKLFQLIVLTFVAFQSLAQENVTISGFVREMGSHERLPGVNVYIENSSHGTASNTYGFYSLTLPKGDSVWVSFSFVGYTRQRLRLSTSRSIRLNVDLEPFNQLEQITVSGTRDTEKISESVQMSRIDVPIAQIKKIPTFFGEKDVIRVLQLLPGVQKGTEGQTGLYVRGGGPDQNLIILDDAVVYNANHLFGFFSVFNADALKSIELTKGGFPARYGGRLSSVIDINMKEGAKDKLHGEGGIGLLSSRLTLEGPLSKKRKSSFLISGRRTYLDVIGSLARSLRRNTSSNSPKSGYYFYDLNTKLNYDLGEKDKIYLSGYFGQDRFYVSQNEETKRSNSGLNWGNATATARWNHLFNQKLFANTSLIYSNFRFNIFTDQTDIDVNKKESEISLKYSSSIRDYSFKTDFDFYPNTHHSIRFGALLTSHQFIPSAFVVRGDFSEEEFKIKAKTINSLEGGLYIEDTWQATDRLKVNGGLRLSTFQTTSKTYVRPEPRIATAFRLAQDFSVKASYSVMNQYVHLLSNTGLGLPTDLWVPTTDKIAPQQSKQFAAGLAKDLENPMLTVTLEGYHKTMGNIISYKEGASFLSVNSDESNEIKWEDNVTSGKGWSYGLEAMVQRKTGKLSGWVGYTLSWTKWKFPELNFGKTFYPRYDRRHDISVVGIYELSKRITLSATWVYGSGNALSVPISKFAANGSGTAPINGYFPVETNLNHSEYGEKNGFRAEPFHRLDLAIQFHKKKRWHERTWEIGVYNAYNRRNPFYYAISPSKNNPGVTTLSRVSLFPFLPSFSYNFKF